MSAAREEERGGNMMSTFLSVLCQPHSHVQLAVISSLTPHSIGQHGWGSEASEQQAEIDTMNNNATEREREEGRRERKRDWGRYMVGIEMQSGSEHVCPLISLTCSCKDLNWTQPLLYFSHDLSYIVCFCTSLSGACVFPFPTFFFSTAVVTYLRSACFLSLLSSLPLPIHDDDDTLSSMPLSNTTWLLSTLPHLSTTWAQNRLERTSTYTFSVMSEVSDSCCLLSLSHFFPLCFLCVSFVCVCVFLLLSCRLINKSSMALPLASLLPSTSRTQQPSGNSSLKMLYL